MKFQPVNTLPEQIADNLCNRIIHFDIKPGERIIELKIAEEFGVSQAPVRESLRILERYRLIDLVPRKGARVTDLSESLIDWIHDVASVLLTLVGRRGVENGTIEDFDKLLESLERLEDSAGKKDIEGYLESVNDYAFCSVKATKNPFLEQMIRDLWPNTLRVQYASIITGINNLEESTALFRETYTHLENGEAEKAGETVRRLVEVERKFALQMLKGGHLKNYFNSKL